jgi:hypothetical protein
MNRLWLPAVFAATLFLPAAAQASSCPQDPQRSSDTWYVTDETTHEELTSEQLARPLPALHSYSVSLTPGSPSASIVEVTELLLTPPAGVPFTREGHSVITTPQTAGALVVSAAWTEHGGVGPDCTRAATLTLNIAPFTASPAVRFKRRVYSDRPLVDFTIAVTRDQLGNPDPIVVRAKVSGLASAPTGQLSVLFTLPLGLPPFGTTPPKSGLLAHRAGKLDGVQATALSAFDSDNVEQIAVPPGGTGARIDFSFDGTGRKLHNNRIGAFYREGVLARRGLAVELTQDGKLLGRLSTGIICASHHAQGPPRCQLPGYRASV